MPQSCTHLYVHFVWATWDRQPLLTRSVRPTAFALIAEECQKLKCLPMEIGGIEDHVHLLVRMNASIAVATIAHHAKGASSHLLRQSSPEFRWQGSYGAFSLGRKEVDKVRAYIVNQEEHHAAGRLWASLEQCSDEGILDPADPDLTGVPTHV